MTDATSRLDGVGSSLGAPTADKARGRWQTDGQKKAACEQFNRHHPVGTSVAYWPGVREGAGVESRTRSEAWVLGGHTPVVVVEGYPGGIALTHVLPIEPYVMDADSGAVSLRLMDPEAVERMTAARVREAQAEGYATALDDVRAAIDESLNLAHLREALRYLRLPPDKEATDD